MTDPSDFWHILPIYVKKDVVHYLDLKTRCNLSYCSKSDFKLVKSTPITFRLITWNAATDNDLARFRYRTLNCQKVSTIPVEFDGAEENVDRLIEMLRAPNTCLNWNYGGTPDDPTDDDVDHYEMKRLIRDLKRKNIRPKLKTLRWYCTVDCVFYDFLTQIDAEYLDKIIVNSECETSREDAQIVETEQWKKAKVVMIEKCRNPTWWFESILDKPNFTIKMRDFSVDKARLLVKTFQEKNHPLGSCFKVTFNYSRLNVQEIFEDIGEPTALTMMCSFYLKTFPLADEALELQVYLVFTCFDSDKEIDQISGVVTHKGAKLKNENLFNILFPSHS